MSPTPRRIQLVKPSDIKITWDDGAETNFPSLFLRQNCPCATCTDYGESPTPKAPEEDQFSLPILGQLPLLVTGAEQVGHYAIQFSFNDGHKSGIYPFELLRKLADLSSCEC